MCNNNFLQLRELEDRHGPSRRIHTENREERKRIVSLMIDFHGSPLNRHGDLFPFGVTWKSLLVDEREASIER